MSEAATAMPEMLENSKGHFVPIKMVEEIDLARTELVMELCGKARAQKQALVDFKTASMADVVAFVQLAGEKYGAKLGGLKGNTTLTSYDGRQKVQIAIQEHHSFDERVQAGKTLFDEVISERTADVDDFIKSLLLDAFEVDKEGRLNTGKILQLCSYKVDDPRWEQGKQAIYDSMHVQGSTAYIRFYERDSSKDKWRSISLDLAAL